MKAPQALNICFILCLLGVLPLHAQKTRFNAEILSTAIASTQDEIPFWLNANTGNEFSEFTNFAGALHGVFTMAFSNASLEAGAYVYARDGVDKNVQRRDLYIQFKNSWLKATAGSKQRDEAFFGLSSTNQNYLYANNARPLPGLIIEANTPLTLFKRFKIDWGIAHYQLNDDRFVKDTRVHYKRLNLQTQVSQKMSITLGVQHFAQWAGTSPEFGKLNDDLDAFINVFIANRSNELGLEGEIENAVGNHLGSFLFRTDVATNVGDVAFYHEHPFEDGSGTAFKNFPDGVWGLTFAPYNTKFIKGFLYEYVDTRSQSVRGDSGRPDNYFTNFVYPSGWTYEQNIIGAPFFIVDKSIDVSSSQRSIIGSRFKVHHIGVAGAFQNVEWSFKTSFSKNLGTHGRPLATPLKNVYTGAEMSYHYRTNHTIALLTGVDVSSVSETIIAGGLSYKYTF